MEDKKMELGMRRLEGEQSHSSYDEKGTKNDEKLKMASSQDTEEDGNIVDANTRKLSRTILTNVAHEGSEIATPITNFTLHRHRYHSLKKTFFEVSNKTRER